MIAVDTNVLIYAHRRDSPWHDKASGLVRSLAEQEAPWAIPWPCVHEFLGTVTRPRLFSPPSTIDEAIGQVEIWLESPSLLLLAEQPDYWSRLIDVLRRGGVVGPQVHDARIAAICILHGARELWSADRDFSRFPDLKVRNPLVS